MADKKKGRDAGRGTRNAKKAAKPSAAKKATAKAATKAAASPEAAKPQADRIAYVPRCIARASRGTRQSPYKMRLVIDQIRHKSVNEALALLAFSKKHAAVQIAKVLKSAVANAEQAARKDNASLDVDALWVKYAVINEGTKMKRWTPAAMGRATPVLKRTSHVEIVVAERAANGGR